MSTPPYEHRYPLFPLPVFLEVIERAAEHRKNATDMKSIIKDYDIVIAIWLEGDDFDADGTLLLPSPNKRTGPVLAFEVVGYPMGKFLHTDELLDKLQNSMKQSPTVESSKKMDFHSWTAVWVDLSDTSFSLHCDVLTLAGGGKVRDWEHYKTSLYFPRDRRAPLRRKS